MFALLIALSSMSSATPHTRPVSADTPGVRDDVADLATLNRLVDDWHDAVRDGDRRAERAADARLERWIRTELADDRQDVRAAGREVRRPSGGRAAARDDRGDAAKQSRDLERTREIARELDTLQVRFSRGTASRADYRRKSSLLRELQTMGKREVGADLEERREDQRGRR
jgi:hypothetical protein